MRPAGITHGAAALLLGFAAGALAGGAAPAAAQSAPASSAGPLFIVGGGRQPDALVERFVELSGGPGRARIAVIPLASAQPQRSGEGKVEHFGEFGAESFVLLTGAEEAASPATIERLNGATGIWFTGGSQSRITRALAGSPLFDAILERNRAGVPIGGTSAGAAIMSPLMITGSQFRAGVDTVGYYGDEFPRIARATIELVPGFGLLSGVIIDQHFVRRERHNRLLSVVLERPDHIGVGIDESTALEVSGRGTWHVRGASVVLVFDAREATISDADAPVLGAMGVRLHVLPPGSSFDPASGTVTLGTSAP